MQCFILYNYTNLILIYRHVKAFLAPCSINELYYHGGQADLNWWGTVRIVAGMCASVP